MTHTPPRFLGTSNRSLKHAFLISGLIATLWSGIASADDAADISKLLRAGQLVEASSKADSALAQKPRDPQIRFMKGLILTEQNKTAEAIGVFTKLTEDYPDLPEPYNNLAVLFASSGQYDKARASLDMAIRTNPTYATAHENLGDVYAKLASQAYDKALQLDSGNSAARSKLTLVRTLTGNTTGGTNPKAAPVTAAAAPAPVPATAVKSAPAVAQAPAPVPAAAAPAKATQAVPTPVPPKASTPAPAADHSEQNEIIDTVHAWAKAWSAKDVKGYLSYYGSDFQTPGKQLRQAWSEERRSRIEGKGRISVKVENPQVTVQGNTATVKFRQVYVSDRLTSQARKTLIMEKQGGKWQIKQEQSGS